MPSTPWRNQDLNPGSVSACGVLVIITLLTALHWHRVTDSRGTPAGVNSNDPRRPCVPSQLLCPALDSERTGKAVSNKTSFTKACGQQVGLPDKIFYFLNLATFVEPDVTVGHSFPTSNLVSA